MPAINWRLHVAIVALLTAAIPLALQSAVRYEAMNSLTLVQYGSDQEWKQGVQRLRYLQYGVDEDLLVHAYSRSTNMDERLRLAKAYQMISGRSIEFRLGEIAD